MPLTLVGAGRSAQAEIIWCPVYVVKQRGIVDRYFVNWVTGKLGFVKILD